MHFLTAFEVYPVRDLIQTQDFIYQLYQKEKSLTLSCFLNSNQSLNCPSTMWLCQKLNLSSAQSVLYSWMPNVFQCYPSLPTHITLNLSLLVSVFSSLGIFRVSGQGFPFFRVLSALVLKNSFSSTTLSKFMTLIVRD